MSALTFNITSNSYCFIPEAHVCFLSCNILTLYLSTMGNLTGPSLDLFKFGKLSKYGMKGNPLKNNMDIRKKRIMTAIIPYNIEQVRRERITYVYQEQKSVGSFRLAPVIPEHGIK